MPVRQPRWPTHVVVDVIDGYVFKGDSSGKLFDGERAHAFAEVRNGERREGHATYQVYVIAKVPTPSFDSSAMGW